MQGILKFDQRLTHFLGGGLQSMPKGNGDVPSCRCFGGPSFCIIRSRDRSPSLSLQRIGLSLPVSTLSLSRVLVGGAKEERLGGRKTEGA